MSTIGAEQYKATQTEAQFMATVKAAAEQRGWIAVHFPNAIINPIWVDLTLIKGRRTLFVELKREGGVLSRKQKALIGDLRAIGAECYVWWPSDWDREIVPVLDGGEA